MEAKRLAMIESALKLFNKYGIKSVSMDDISCELGISKKTLYQYISDKNELVESALNLACDKMSEAMMVFKQKDVNAIEQLFEYAEVFAPKTSQYQPSMKYDLRKYYPNLLKNTLDKRRQLVYETHINNLQKGKKEGLYEEDINEDFIARFLLAHNEYTFDEECGIFDADEIKDKKTTIEAFKYHFRGICTKKGWSEVERLFKTYTLE